MKKITQSSIKVIIVILLIAASLGLISIVSGNFTSYSIKIFSSCMALVLFGLLAAPCLVVAENPLHKILGTIGVIVAAAGFIFTSALFLFEKGNETLIKFAFSLTIASFVFAYICILYHINAQNKYAGATRIVASVAISIFGFIFLTRLFGSPVSVFTLFDTYSILKPLLSFLIIAIAATALIPLCNRLNIVTSMEDNFITEEQPETIENEIPEK